MLRYVWPLIFFGVAGWVWQYNHSHTDRKILFPFVDAIVPSTAGDPAAMGEVSVYLIVVCAVLVTVSTVVGHVRDRRRQAELDARDDEA